MKMKTHKGASKRFTKTGSGKIVHHQAGKRHLLSHKKRDRKRRLSGTAVVTGRATAILQQLLPR